MAPSGRSSAVVATNSPEIGQRKAVARPPYILNIAAMMPRHKRRIRNRRTIHANWGFRRAAALALVMAGMAVGSTAHGAIISASITGGTVFGTGSVIKLDPSNTPFSIGSDNLNTDNSASPSDMLRVFTIGTLSAVPEPTTWAMALAGLGTVGFAMRRRRRTRVSFA